MGRRPGRRGEGSLGDIGLLHSDPTEAHTVPTLGYTCSLLHLKILRPCLRQRSLVLSEEGRALGLSQVHRSEIQTPK